MRDRESVQAGLRFGAAAGRALVADFSARTRSRTRKRRNCRGMVVGLDLHQRMGRFGRVPVRPVLIRIKARDIDAFHDGRVIRIGNYSSTGIGSVRVPHHAEQRLVLFLSVDDPVGVENLVAAMLRIGLREHRQFDVRRIASHTREILDQVVDFIVRQRQAHCAVGLHQRGATACEEIDRRQGFGLDVAEQVRCLIQRAEYRLGHAIVNQRQQSPTVRFGKFSRRAPDNVAGNTPLDAVHGPKAAGMGNVGGLGRPGRYRADARYDQEHFALPGGRLRGRAVDQDAFEDLVFGGRQRRPEGNEVPVFRGDRGDAGCGLLEELGKLLEAEVRQGVAAAQRQEVGHFNGSWVSKPDYTQPTRTPRPRRPSVKLHACHTPPVLSS